MKQTFIMLIVVMAQLVRPSITYSQSLLVNELISAMVTAGFDFSENDKLRMAKVLAEKGVINCQVKEWGKSVEASTLSNQERIAFLEERAKEFETKVNFVSRRLGTIVGDNDQSRNLARSIARDNDLTVILDEVMPSVESLVERVRGELQDDLEIVRIISGEYRLKFESLCQKVNDIERRLSNLEQYQTLKPIARDNPPSAVPIQVPQPQAGQREMFPDRIVGSKSYLCSSSVMIRKCYDYTQLEEINGRLVRRAYHGDLYSDCSGFILVTHVKTGGAPSRVYQG